MSHNILVLGASGAVGRQVINQAVQRTDIGKIYAPVRSLERFNTVLPKTVPDEWKEQHLFLSCLDDFAKLEAWLDQTQIDVNTCSVVSCLGSTLKKAGSSEKFRAIDYELALNLAKICEGKGFEEYHVVSAAGASASSPILYGRTKGELEESLKKLKFKSLFIYRPSLLLTEDGRHESRPLETVCQTVAKWTDWLNVVSIGTPDVARAILASCCANEKSAGVHTMSVRDMLKLAKTSPKNSSKS